MQIGKSSGVQEMQLFSDMLSMFARASESFEDVGKTSRDLSFDQYHVVVLSCPRVVESSQPKPATRRNIVGSLSAKTCAKACAKQSSNSQRSERRLYQQSSPLIQSRNQQLIDSR